MVKFSKQLEGSLVPEWKDAYCNYKELKKDVKRIKQDRLNAAISRSGSISLMRSLGSLGSMTSLHNLGSHLKRQASASGFSLRRAVSGEVLVVQKAEPNDDHGVEVYETDLMEPLGHAEQDRIFFNRLDAELNKINRFYRGKEAEYVAQANRLEKQLLALFEVQEALARQSMKLQTFSKTKGLDSSNDDDNDESDGGSSTSSSHESPLLQIITVKSVDDQLHRLNNVKEKPATIAKESAKGSSDEEMKIIADFIENVEVTETPAAQHGDDDWDSHGHHQHKNPPSRSTMSFRNGGFPFPERDHQSLRTGSDSVPLVVHQADASPFHAVQSKDDFHARLQRVRETVEHQCIGEEESSGHRHHHGPKSIIQDMIDMSLGKKKIQSFKKMLRIAFIEFYRGLGLLKSYSSLNLVAFAKIMKKYDKVVQYKLGPLYVKEVERSYFASSEKVTNLMAKVEDIFTKHFSEHDRRKAMAQLRPMQQRGGHSITFFLGIFSGISMALLVGLIVFLSTSEKYRTMGGNKYMNTVFHVFSTLGLVLLHMYMYGWNVYAWQRTHINYAFIFEFSPGTELRYREVLLVCTGFTSLLLGTMIAHIVASTKEAPKYYSSEFAPMGITLIFLVSLFTPLNVLYRSSRAFFLRCMQHILFSPFYKVVLADFFLGDQLTSQVASFRNIEFMMCYYSGGYFQRRDENACTNNKTFRELMYVFSLLPYWFRFLQCLRRWRDDGDKKQLYNAGKYASAMVAVVARLTYQSKGSTTRLVLFILFSALATLYQLYWDLVVDWGLLQRHSKNRWLRDSIVLKKKYLYFVSMAVNVVLRLAWISSIQHVNAIRGFSQPAWDVIFASLEVIRRGHWNFYRLENEHLNNVGKYRAVKTVPLPFKEFEGATL